jgi:hypothetical protein
MDAVSGDVTPIDRPETSWLARKVEDYMPVRVR